MDGRIGIPVILVGAALIVLGLSLGSTAQKETFIGNEVVDDPAVGGDITILTAILVGLGVAAIVLALGNAGRGQRIGGAAMAGLCAWWLVFLVQAGWPSYTVVPEVGVAAISHNNLLVETLGAPSVLLPVLAMGAAALMGFAWGIARAQLWAPAPISMTRLRQTHLVLAAAALPTYAVVAAGFIRVMLDVPADDPRQGLLTVLHPLVAAACMLLATTTVVRVHQLARSRVDPDTTWPVMESWRALDRIDLAGFGLLVVLALFASLLPGDQPNDVTRAGSTLLFTLRSHGQSIIFLAGLLVPSYLVNRRIGDGLALAREEVHASDAHALAAAWVVLGVSMAGALLGAIIGLAVDSSLLPWVLAFAPAAAVAGILGSTLPSGLLRLMLAWAMWSMGNSFNAFYDANSFPDIDFYTHPGVLALWRMGAVSIGAWALYDMVARMGSTEKAWVRIPIALGASLGPAFVALMMLPLDVWAEARIPTDRVAVGSLLRHQLTGVQVTMHVLSAIFLLGTCLGVARLARPEWFHGNHRVAPAEVATPG